MVHTVQQTTSVDQDHRTPAERRAALRAFLDKLDAEGRAATAAEREFLIQIARGSFADILTSSEDFMRRKQREIELEDAGYRRPTVDS
jgi:hypothetical protein